jgi:Family of unknown function (DUF5984)
MFCATARRRSAAGVDGTFARREFPDDDELGNGIDVAFDLQSDFNLDLGYLSNSPILRCWRHRVEGRDVITLSQEILTEDRGTFDGPPRLQIMVPAVEFFAAVADSDRRFIAVIGERVAELEQGGPPASVDLDLEQLRREHEQRSRWLERRLSEPRNVDWETVRTGVSEISSRTPVAT